MDPSETTEAAAKRLADAGVSFVVDAYMSSVHSDAMNTCMMQPHTEHALRTVGFNLSLSSLHELSRAGFIDGEREVSENRRMVEAMRVKTASLEVKVGTLSGGNQQKVVLGRALMTGPKVVLLDEPTRGIDIGAKSEIYALVRELTGQGLGVVLVSSELPELIGLADRILMLSEGQLGGSFEASEATQAGLLSAAMSKGRAPVGAEEHG